MSRSNRRSRGIAMVALVTGLAVALAITPAAALQPVDPDGSLVDGGSLDGSVGSQTADGGDSNATTGDVDPTDGTDDGGTSGLPDTNVTSDPTNTTGTDDLIGTNASDVDGGTASATVESGNLTGVDGSVEGTVGEEGTTIDADAGIDTGDDTTGNASGIGASLYAAVAADEQDNDGQANGSTGTAPGTGDGGQADGTGTGDETAIGSDGDSGGLSGTEQAGAGVAIGSLLVGGGLLARRFGETVALAGGSGAGGGSLLSAATAWVRAWGWRILALFGYQRLDSSDPLEHETRASISEEVERDPGVFLAELQETTEVPMSTLRYHLRILEFEDVITSEKVRGKRRYFPAAADRDALEPALADEATAAVLEAVAHEPDSVSGLADRLDRDPSTVTHHLQRLDDEGLVEREREGRSVVSRLADEIDRTDVAAATAGHAD